MSCFRALIRGLVAFAFALAVVDAGATSGTDPAIGDATTQRLLALDPAHVSASDVRDVLAHAPAPRIILIQGSVAFVNMEPFAEFLVAMGYPAERLKDPDGTVSRSSFGSSTELAGTLAWYYEREGMVPLLIGHSQGGMLVMRTLHELNGEFGQDIPVWDPVSRAALPRTSIVDPRTGAQRPIVGLRVPYAAAIATGKLMRVMLGQWTMLPLLRKVPDTVDDFTGFTLEWDPIAGSFPGAEPYVATGTAHVRNVTLPASYHHIDLPNAAPLATNRATREWIDHYTPGEDVATAPPEARDAANLLHAADIWYSVRKHWCLEAQRLAQPRGGA